MADRFKEYINSNNDGSVEFIRLTAGIPVGTQVMLIRPLMDYEPGSVFTYAPARACEGGKTYKYKGIGEAFFFDTEGNPIILMGGRDVLDESFILVTPEQPKIITETISDNKPTVIVEKIQGKMGKAGLQGDRGEDGIPGVRGAKGSKGDKGDRGDNGKDGRNGKDGKQGEDGVVGQQGIQGEKGNHGEKGEQGEQGEKGLLGERGEKGDTGEKGIRGERGVSGKEGKTGEKGERGDPGSEGSKGEKGDLGERGEKGDKGDEGKPGKDGKHGDAGKQGERGTQGIQGMAGERGLVGDQGEKGDQGERGDQGEKGDQGDSGLLSVQYPLRMDKDRKHLSIDLSKLKPNAPILYDGGGGLGEAFKFISVSGQSGLTAVQYDKETLTFVAGSGIDLITDPSSNTITINNLGGGFTGFSGVQGVTGATGAQGNTGATGSQGIQGVTGATGAQGIQGGNAGRIYYLWAGVTADVAGYKTASTSPSPNAITSITTTVNGTGDVFIASFITDVGEPGVGSLPTGIAERLIHVYQTGNENCIAKLNFQLWKRDLAGTETLLRSGYSENFSNQTKAELRWSVAYATAFSFLPTDRLVFKVYAARVSGSSSFGVITSYEGEDVSYVKTTISAGAVGPQGATGATGAIPTNYVISLNGLTGAVGMTGDGGAIYGNNNNTITARLGSTGATGVASFDDTYFTVAATGHVAIKTGIKAGNIIVLGTSSVFGVGATGALPALDGSLLVEVDAKYLRGKNPNQLTDGGTF